MFDRILEEVKGDNPWCDYAPSIKALYFGTLTGTVDQIDRRLGRPTTPPSRSVVEELAMPFAVQAVARHPKNDFGPLSDRMRQSVVSTITDGYFEEMRARKRWGSNA